MERIRLISPIGLMATGHAAARGISVVETRLQSGIGLE